MTALAAALEKAGSLSKADMPAYMTALAYVSAGGTRDGWARLYELALVKAKAPNDDAKVSPALFEQVLSRMPFVSSPKVNGSGPITRAQPRPASLATPIREPSAGYKAAAAAGAKQLARTLLDTVHTSDGRSWGDVGAHELDGMVRDGVMSKLLREHLGALSNSQRTKPIRELINAATFGRIAAKARENNDGA